MTDFTDLDEPQELAAALLARWPHMTESERNALRDLLGGGTVLAHIVEEADQ